MLVTSILSLGDDGVGINKFEIRKIVQNYLNTTNQSHVFKNTRQTMVEAFFKEMEDIDRTNASKFNKK